MLRALPLALASASLLGPPLPAPFGLPELAHPTVDARVDWLIGRVEHEGTDRAAAAAVAFASYERSVAFPRRLYLGLTLPFAAALPPDGALAPQEIGRAEGMRAGFGNVEGHVRAVFPMPSGLEIGFVLAATAPTSTFARGDRADRSATIAAASLDPTSHAQLLPGAVTLRPAGDLRIRRGAFVVQARHGLDIQIPTSDDRLEGERVRVRLAGRLLAHVGWLVTSDVELSLEASQLYFFASDDADPRAQTVTPTSEQRFTERYRTTDGRRSSLVIGPGLRFKLGAADVGVQYVRNASDPLSPAADDASGLRFSLVGHM